MAAFRRFVFVSIIGAGLASGCARIRDTSALREVSMVEDPSGFPATMALEITRKDGSLQYCVGSFIRNDLMLTAAHCLIEAKRAVVIGSFAPFLGEKPESRIGSEMFSLHPAYTAPAAGSPPPAHADMGLLHFPKNTAPLELVARLSTTPPSEKAIVYLLGYSGTPGKAGEGKEVDRHRIAAVEDGKGIKLQQPSELEAAASSTLLGSGSDASALYNDNFELIGLQSQGPQSAAPQEIRFLSLHDPVNRSFIDQAVAEPAKIPAVIPKKLTASHKISYGCVDKNAIFLLLPTSKPPSLKVAGTCKPILSCKGASLEAKGPVATSTSLLQSAEQCLAIKTELDKVVNAPRPTP